MVDGSAVEYCLEYSNVGALVSLIWRALAFKHIFYVQRQLMHRQSKIRSGERLCHSHANRGAANASMESMSSRSSSMLSSVSVRSCVPSFVCAGR